MGNPYAPRKKATPENIKETQEERTEDLPKTPDAGPKETPKEPEKPALEVPDTNMEGILDWVGEDKERAAAAIENERAAQKPRKTLLSKLGDI